MKEKAEILLEMVKELRSVGDFGYNKYSDTYSSVEELAKDNFSDNPVEAVRASAFGSFNYTDDVFWLNDYRNIESCSIDTFEREILELEYEILSDYLETFKEDKERFELYVEYNEIK